MTPVKQKYQQEVAPKLIEEFKYSSPLAVPRLKKIVINTGIGQPQDPRARRRIIDNVADQYAIITGQKAQVTIAHRSISNFKVRQGDPMGVRVTLRGDRMWQFLQKLISVALPRVKDFQGVSRTAFDGQGNYSMGIEEQIIFPEIEYDKIESVRSLQVVFTTTAKSNDEAFRLLELLGVPFAKYKVHKKYYG